MSALSSSSAASPRGRSPRTHVIAGLGAAIFTLLLRVPFLRLPFGQQDEGYYATIARAAADGAGLYTDLGYVRPPGLNAVYTLAWHVSDLLGVGYDITVRLFAALFAAATVGVLAVYLFRRFRILPAALGTLLAALLSASLTLQNEANAETWLMLPYTVSALLVLWSFEEDLPPRQRGMAIVAAGALTGVAAMFKEVALVNLALPLVAGVTLLGWRQSRDALRATVQSVAGAASVAGVMVLGLAVAGELRDFVYYTWVTRVDYAVGSIEQMGTRALLRRQLTTIGRVLVWPGVFTALAAIPALTARDEEHRSDQRLLVVAVGWLALSGVGIVASGRFYEHYFIQATIPLALVMAAAVAVVTTATHSRARSIASAVVVVLASCACTSAALAWMGDVGGVPRLDAGRSQWRELAGRVDELTPVGGRLLIWGDVASLTAYARTPEASTMTALYYPMGSKGGDSALGAHFPSVGDRLYASLQTSPPDTVVVAAQLGDYLPGARVSWFRPRDDTRAERLLLRLIDEEYEEVGRGPWHIIFVRAGNK